MAADKHSNVTHTFTCIYSSLLIIDFTNADISNFCWKTMLLSSPAGHSYSQHIYHNKLRISCKSASSQQINYGL